MTTKHGLFTSSSLQVSLAVAVGVTDHETHAVQEINNHIYLSEMFTYVTPKHGSFISSSIEVSLLVVLGVTDY